MYLIINSECNSIPENAQPLVSEGNALLNLLHCLGYDADNPPLGDLLRHTHHLEGDWLVLSPIHWQATHNDALIMATGKELGLNETESKTWFQFFADYLAAESMTLHYHDAETWLLQDSLQRPLNAKPASRLLSQSLMPELAQLDQNMFWQRFITESQMLIASKSIPTVMNGLWPWGNAKLADKKAITLCADEYFLSIAQSCSSQVNQYHPNIKLKEQQILLISDFSTLSQEHQKELKNLSVQWYWNNVAYAEETHWFARLWRKITHAN